MNAPLRRLVTSLVVAVAILVSLLAAAPAQAATSAEAGAEQDFHALVNVERAKRGLGALTMRGDIVRVARDHSARMAREWELYHNPGYAKQITGWQRVSENVGYGPSVARIHQALMESDGHRRNILDERVTEVGIGVVVKDGRVWVTQNFRRPRTTVTTSAPSTPDYGDVSSTSVHAGAIQTVATRGITDPCGSARFCPESSVTRAEFATMLARTLELPKVTTQSFADVSGAHAPQIEALASAGLTSGCDGERFCPEKRLTREQMATFFARALELQPRPSPFTDMASTHDGSVGALHRDGIVSGCTASRFCPTEPVTRAQTASMIVNHLT